MTTLNVRVDEKVKARAAKTLASIGLDMSAAVNMFLRQVIHDKGMPFHPTQNRNFARLRAQWDKEAAYALKHGKAYTSGEELLSDMGL